MLSTLTSLIDKLDSEISPLSNVIRWGCPVPVFGDLSNSAVATVGLNPSNREFVDPEGKELNGTYRRFHTLGSLGIRNWSDVDAIHLHLIIESCRNYFAGNPYNRWFKKMDDVISATKSSFYDGDEPACHLDLIPYATAQKWTDLSKHERDSLLAISHGFLGALLRDSPVRLLVLNGRSVVENFQIVANVILDQRQMEGWTLRRNSAKDVLGIAYSGRISVFSGIKLEKEVLVLGYNHNIQSSFGVTTDVVKNIQTWVGQASNEILN